MTNALRWTSADLESLPDDGKRYEIVDGELFISEPTDWWHQRICCRMIMLLHEWSCNTARGTTNIAPGIIFDKHNDVAPDVIWISTDRLKTALEDDGKLHHAPEIAIEVLSPGTKNESRDRDAKRKLYSRRGVQEYWIIDWRLQQIEVYRREQAALTLVATLYAQDTLESPLLPGFSCAVERLFAGM